MRCNMIGSGMGHLMLSLFPPVIDAGARPGKSLAPQGTADDSGRARQFMNKLPLSRFKIVDLTRVRAGPTCVRQLSDWGAEVIKVEAAEGDGGLGGERHGFDFQNLHRNKRSITLNLKKPDGLAVLKALVKDADVLVENYRPDVKFRLGIDYERCGPSTRGWSMPASRASARPAPIATGLASIRSRKAWAGSCR